MEIIFKEKCDLCCKEQRLSEYEDFDTGKTYVDEEGNELSIPTWAKTKGVAKEYFKSEGWSYYKKLIFCKRCFKELKNGFVVLDRFNQFYNLDGSCDAPDSSHVMAQEMARKLASNKNTIEVLYFTQALPVIIKTLRGEWEVDVVGFFRAHPNIEITIREPFSMDQLRDRKSREGQ